MAWVLERHGGYDMWVHEVTGVTSDVAPRGAVPEEERRRPWHAYRSSLDERVFFHRPADGAVEWDLPEGEEAIEVDIAAVVGDHEEGAAADDAAGAADHHVAPLDTSGDGSEDDEIDLDTLEADELAVHELARSTGRRNPKRWKEFVDRKGRPYYVDMETGRTVRYMPEELKDYLVVFGSARRAAGQTGGKRDGVSGRRGASSMGGQAGQPLARFDPGDLLSQSILSKLGHASLRVERRTASTVDAARRAARLDPSVRAGMRERIFGDVEGRRDDAARAEAERRSHEAELDDMQMPPGVHAPRLDSVEDADRVLAQARRQRETVRRLRQRHLSRDASKVDNEASFDAFIDDYRRMTAAIVAQRE